MFQANSEACHLSDPSHSRPKPAELAREGDSAQDARDFQGLGMIGHIIGLTRRVCRVCGFQLLLLLASLVSCIDCKTWMWGRRAVVEASQLCSSEVQGFRDKRFRAKGAGALLHRFTATMLS